jgi:protein phosphatase
MNDESKGIWDGEVEDAAGSDIGLRRTSNQDSYAVVSAPDADVFKQQGHLYLVADGMGAHAAGELASKLAVDSIPLTYSKLVQKSPIDALRSALEDANGIIFRRGQANLEFHNMGTTASALALTREGAVVAHVGDSRVYRLRGGRLEQLTFDHSLVWEMMAGGQISEDQLATYIPRNIITRSLGPNAAVDVDIEGPFPVQAGDSYLLCSDGLSGQVKDEEIAAVLGALSPSEAVQALIDLANLRGGPDNVTVIVTHVPGPPPAGEGQPSAASPPGLNPWTAWGTLALAVIALLAAIGLFLSERDSLAFGAVAVGVAATLAFLAMLWIGIGKPSPPAVEPIAGAHGKGPYTTAQAAPRREFIDALQKLLQELREAANDNHWIIEWSKLQTFTDGAAAAVESKDLPEAVRQYCRAVSFLMAQIRGQHGKNPDLPTTG